MGDIRIIEISSVKDTDDFLKIRNSFRDLFVRVFDKELSDEKWNHYYLNCPYGCATSFLYYSKEGSLIGHGGVIPQRLISQSGEVYDYYLQTAVMVDKECRNLLAFKKIMEAIHKYVVDKNTFSLAFPNDNSYGQFIKIFG